MGGYGYPVGVGPLRSGLSAHDRESADDGVVKGDPHLRGIRQITDYHLHARDGEIGHVTDFLIEDGDWSVRYLVVETANWWPAKKVLISPRSIEGTDWLTRVVKLAVLREQVRGSPAYDGSEAVDRAYEYAFHGYYDRLPVIEPL